MLSKDVEEEFDYDVGAAETFDAVDQIGKGTFDMKTPLDGSREEVRSSWSSSEEALAACEGLLYNVPLNGGPKCTPEAGADVLRDISTEVTVNVDASGFYYFIFANENEITDNFLSASFDLHKSAFDTSESVSKCENATACELPLTFWSTANVVVAMDEDDVEENANCSVVGYSSLTECHEVVGGRSECKPRSLLYGVLVALAPILVLIFANL